ncbi:Hypothetical protein PBC10988_28620 [Planctomycetales bacterium 10988]|nr:Hypothetical protein PBC10988_28620 [Planctomycetales bacterium 10988]
MRYFTLMKHYCVLLVCFCVALLILFNQALLMPFVEGTAFAEWMEGKDSQAAQLTIEQQQNKSYQDDFVKEDKKKIHSHIQEQFIRQKRATFEQAIQDEKLKEMMRRLAEGGTAVTPSQTAPRSVPQETNSPAVQESSSSPKTEYPAFRDRSGTPIVSESSQARPKPSYPAYRQQSSTNERPEYPAFRSRSGNPLAVESSSPQPRPKATTPPSAGNIEYPAFRDRPGTPLPSAYR